METVYIVRHSTSEQGTVGVLKVGSFVCPTLELHWLNNISSFSCIPEGEYLVRYTKSPSMKRYTYEVVKVPKRGGIRIHSGNYGGDTRKGYLSHILGCILLGSKIYKNAGPKKQLMIGSSGPTIAAFESFMKKQDFKLNITWLDKTTKPLELIC